MNAWSRRTAVLLLLASTAPARADSGIEFFEQKIRPVLVEHCYKCHSAASAKPKGGLLLDSRLGVLRGGDQGPAVVPGKVEESLIIQALRHDGLKMPPSKKLDDQVIEDFVRWVKLGAPDPRQEDLSKARREKEIQDAASHWAFKKPVAAPGPKVKNDAWSSHPIDAFLAQQQEARGLTPAGPAAKATRLRRVYLDLIGLPPRPDELEAFLADPSPKAYEAVVDRLLADPRHGERWARHWMDVWRYSDYYGRGAEVRFSQPHLWRWRDWIVESLNADVGFDRMVAAMLAGDELAPDDPATLRATGYLARNAHAFNRNTWLADTVDHASKAFLGLTVACARCHDHKYDPVSQEEYYQLRAIFEPYQVRTEPVNGSDPVKEGLTRVFDDAIKPTFRFLRGDETQPDTKNPLSPGTPRVLGGSLRIEAIKLPDTARPPAGSQIILGSTKGRPVNSKLEPVSTGRRLAFARWLTDREHPLTARVAVNHLWLRHFGRPLVPTVFDFGRNGTAPTHPELLDWLAVTFMQEGWSMRKLHRLIVTSQAYQMEASGPAASLKLDPDNLFVHRFHPRQAEAEVIRDSLLYLGGNLGETRGGPDLNAAQDFLPRRSLYFTHAPGRQMVFLELFNAPDPTECYVRESSIVPQQSLALLNSPLALEQSRRLARRLGTPETDVGEDQVFVTRAFQWTLSRSPTSEEAERCLAFLKTQAELLADVKSLTPVATSGGPKAASKAGSAPEPTPPSSHPRLRARENLVHALINHHEFLLIP